MNSELILKIMDLYAVTPVEFFKPQKGYRNYNFSFLAKDNKKYNLILFKNEDGILRKIKNSNYVSNFLQTNKFPVRSPINAQKIMQIDTKRSIRFACLFNYLDGETIPWEAYTKDHIKLLGKVMSMMHSELHNLNFKKEEFDKVILISFEQLNRMQKYFSNASVSEALLKKLTLKINKNTFSRFKILLNNLATYDEDQLLHMDFVRSNILFQTTESENEFSVNNLKVAGILDFEKVAYGPRIFDIARTLAFLIIDCKYKKEEKVRKYFLYSGYNRRGPQSLPSLEYLENLVNYFLFYDFYKFLRHNPYEYLLQNEHFVRTKDKLLKNDVLIND